MSGEIFELKTAPNDIRFASSTNQAKHCWTLYNTLIKCEIKHGYKAPECVPVTKNVITMCPNDWLTEWREQREAGTFPGIAHPPPPQDDDDDE